MKKRCTCIVERREDFSGRIKRERWKVGIDVVCAPFKADWEFIEAQRAGLIDIIISDDGDLFAIGGDNIVSELDYHTGACCLYKRAEVLARPCMSNGMYADELPALSNFLGNDFIPRLDGNRPAITRHLMDQFVGSAKTERKMMIEVMGVTRVWITGDVQEDQ